MYNIKEKFDKYQSRKHYASILADYLLDNLNDFQHINDVNVLSGVYLDKLGEKYSIERQYVDREDASQDYFFDKILYEYLYGDRTLVEPYLMNFNNNIEDQINYIIKQYNNGNYKYGDTEKQVPYDIFFREDDQSYRDRILQKVFRGVRTNTMKYVKMYQNNTYGLDISLKNILYDTIENTLFMLQGYFKDNNNLLLGDCTDDQISFVNYNPQTGSLDFSQTGQQSLPIANTDGWVKVYDGIIDFEQDISQYTCNEYNGAIYNRDMMVTNIPQVIMPNMDIQNVEEIYFYDTYIIKSYDDQILLINDGSQISEQSYIEGDKIQLSKLIKLNNVVDYINGYGDIQKALETIIQGADIPDNYDIIIKYNDGTNSYFANQQIDTDNTQVNILYNEIDVPNVKFILKDSADNEVQYLSTNIFYLQDDATKIIDLNYKRVFIDENGVKRESVIWYQEDTSQYQLVDGDVITYPQEIRLNNGVLEYRCDIGQDKSYVSNEYANSSWVKEYDLYYDPIYTKGTIYVDFTYSNENEIKYNLHIPSIKSFPVMFHYTDGSQETKIINSDENIQFDKQLDYFEIYLFDLINNLLVYGKYDIQASEPPILYRNQDMDEGRYIYIYNSNNKEADTDENILLTLYKGERTNISGIQQPIVIEENSGMLSSEHFQQQSRDIKFKVDGIEISEDTFFDKDVLQTIEISNVIGPFIPVLYFGSFIKLPDEYINLGNVNYTINEDVTYDNNTIENIERTIYFGDNSTYKFNVKISSPYTKFRIIYIHPMSSMYSEEVVSPIMQYKQNNIPVIDVSLSGRNNLRLYNNCNIKIDRVEIIIYNDGDTYTVNDIDRLSSKNIELSKKYDKVFQVLYIYDKQGRQYTKYIQIENNIYHGYVNTDYGIIVQNNSINAYSDGNILLEYTNGYSLNINMLSDETLPIPDQCQKIYIDGELKYIKNNKNIVINGDEIMGVYQLPQKVILSNNRIIKVQTDKDLLQIIKNNDIVNVVDLYGDVYEVYILGGD